MNLRKGFRRGTAFLMALLMILMLSGHGTEIVFAEETTNVQAGVDFTALDDHLVEGMTPKGTRIHLFDYWSTQREANDRISNSDDGGINAGHDFKFTHGSNGFDNMNAWTGSSNPRTGIVKNKLGENGYPEFSKRAGQKEESLDYIFDPSIRHEGKASYDNVEGLLQVDQDGYYYYDCQKNYAAFDESTKKFKLYDEPGVFTGDKWSRRWTTSNSNNGQFFPFNTADGVFTERRNQLEQLRVNSKSNTDNNRDQQSDEGYCESPFNHYFGLSMSTQFIQRDGGHTEEDGPAMTYEFSGDDDVWVFIDNVLVADLGGIHSKATLRIDFSTGNIYINENLNGNLREKFRNAGISGNFIPGTNIFTDDTYHTLDFFYLERGNADSNMHLKFNLVTVPESEIIKVDQIGEAVPGAAFTLYHTNSDYAIDDQTEVIATGTTDEKGQFVLISPDGRLISLQNLNEYKEKYFVLKETTVPMGYRTAGDGEIKLYIPENVKSPVLLTYDSWNTGSRSLAKLMTTADPVIHLVPNAGGSEGPEGNSDIDLGNGGKMFAVVLQYDHSDETKDLTNPNNWHAVSGDPIGGWMVQEGTAMSDIIAAAKQNPYVFELDSSGAYKAEVEELVGDVLKYYFMQGNPTAENTDYTVGYYYTTENSLDDATADNTWRVQSDDFERMFAARLYVPNIENHVYVRKVDEAGNAVRGAEFGLFSESNDGIDIGLDGSVTISKDAEPDYRGTTDIISGYPFKDDIEGSLIFPQEGGLPMGTYYLKELSVPEGYKRNDKIIKIVIDQSGIYPDAGEKDDGIVVNRSIGMIVKSMVQFAAGDDVDNTLHDLIMNLKVSNSYNGDQTQWKGTDQTTYLKFQPDDSQTILEYAALEGYPAMFDIDEGWSGLEIKQNYEDPDHGVSSHLKMDWREYELRNLFSGVTFVTVTNERVGDLEVSKQVQSDWETDKNQKFQFKVRFHDVTDPYKPIELTQTYKVRITDLEGNPVETQISEIKSGDTIQLKDDQKLTVYGLPYGTQYTITEARTPGYTPSVSVNGNLTEGTSSEEGYAVSGKIEWTGNDGGAAVEKVVYTNTYNQTGEFGFTKTDKNRNPVEGAKFAMYRLECEDVDHHDHEQELLQVDAEGNLTDVQKTCWEGINSVESDSNGKVLFEGLPASGEYRLVEYKAAPGYVTPKGQWRVIYTEGKFIFPSSEGSGDMDSAVGNPPAVEMDADGYSIANYKLTELPFSGNIGIGAFWILGITFMAVGGLGGLLWLARNKRCKI